MNESELVEYSRHLNKMHIINEGISEQLFGSIIYLLKYSEKYGVKLPKKEELERILLNTKPLLESYNQSIEEFEKIKAFFKNPDQPMGNTRKDQPSRNQNHKN